MKTNPNTTDFDMLDLQQALYVEFYVDQQSKCWLNINGKCAVRIGLADDITIKDERKKGTK